MLEAPFYPVITRAGVLLSVVPCRSGLVRGWSKTGKGRVKSVSMVPLSCLYPFSMLDVVHGDVPVRIEFPSQDVFVDPAGARKLYLRTRRTDFTGSFRFEGNSDMQCRIHAVGLSASRMMMSCSWGETLRYTQSDMPTGWSTKEKETLRVSPYQNKTMLTPPKETLATGYPPCAEPVDFWKSSPAFLCLIFSSRWSGDP